MDNYKNIDIVIGRINTAAYDLALADIANQNQNEEAFIKHSRDAGEAISQSLEFALKFHINKCASSREKAFLSSKKHDLHTLIDLYVDGDGNDNGYLYITAVDDIEPSVDFAYLKNNKKHITNNAKHNGGYPDFKIQKNYFLEVQKFFHQYIGGDVKLKSVEDFKKVDLSNWDLFYSSCDRFKRDERNYILVSGPNKNLQATYLKNLGIPKWDLVIDFDYFSLESGIFEAAFKNKDLPSHILKSADNIDTNSFSRFSNCHYHYFADNFKGSGHTSVSDFSNWNRKYGRNTDLLIKSFSEVFANQKNIVVVLFDDRRYVNFLCEKMDYYFGNNTKYVFVGDFDEKLLQVSEDFSGLRVNISISQLSEGLANFSSNFGYSPLSSNDILIPFIEKSLSETSGTLTPAEFSQLEEYFEVVHKGLPDPTLELEERKSFLIGESKISWSGLRQRFDVERQNFQRKYIKPIEKIIENGRAKIQLIHEAGFGGTTVARRIAWDLHMEYPTLILKGYKEQKVKEALLNLHDKTRKTIFLIIEVPQTITLDEVDALYRSIPLARPIVLLIVRRGKVSSSNNELVLSDWGNDVVDLINVYKPYLSQYSEDVRARKENELNEIIFSTDSYKKTPFYIGLLTFEEHFSALKDYIKNFIIEVSTKDQQKKVLLYLSLCDYYLGLGLPSIFFKTLFKVEHQDVIHLDQYFSSSSSIVESILQSNFEGNQKFWKIRHAFFSRELKNQILSGNSENPEIWRQFLADACVNFINDSMSDSYTSEYVQDILQKLFIGNKRDRAGGDFTAIINDIQSVDDKERVFIALKEAYPNNPHYCSHLARFYAYHNKNSEKALKYADEAIMLSEYTGNADPLLYHIKGMCLRSIVYDEITRQRKIRAQGGIILEDKYFDVIDNLVPKAATQFELARQIARKQNKLDEYGFIAHIQLLTSAIDYAIFISGKSNVEFFNQNIEPFSDWLDLAESLLEEVKQINVDDDESGKIADCVNEIIAFYENYDQILQNLRNQLEKGRNPSRTRRQIVRTYFRKKEDFSKNNKTINNILSLMEENIINEPDNERNYYLWFQASRYSKISVEETLNKLSKWKVNSQSIDAIYYFYILKTFRAIEGYSESVIDAYNLIIECRAKGKSNISIFEWYGKGSGINRLVSNSEITVDNKDDKLELVEGYFTDYFHAGSGRITIANKLDVFFSPTIAKLTSNDLNKQVKFYLGFSYDGLRADSTSVRLLSR